MPVSEVMTTDVVKVEPDTKISDVVERMKDEEVGSAVVVEDDSPISVVTDRKIALSVAEVSDIQDKSVQEIMSGDIIKGEESMTVMEALQQMSSESIRRLPIVDDEGSLVGIVTLDDIFVLISSELEQASDIVESQSARL